jgi:hypothetical protein
MKTFSSASLLSNRIIFCVGIVIVVLVLVKNRYFVHDDAFISLRYALNLAEHGMLQWNLGEWAEGYTSVLHVFLMSLAIRWGAEPVVAAHLTNGLAVIALISLSVYAAQQIRDGARFERLLMILAITATPSLAIWLLGGLEAVLVAAFMLAGLTALIADNKNPRAVMPILGVLAFSAAILTRLDSAPFIAGSGLAFFLTSKRSFKVRTIIAILIVAIPAFVSLAQMAIRYSVYGELFPLTFYAKTELPMSLRLGNGFSYLVASVRPVPILAIALLICIYALIFRRFTRNALLLAFPIGFHIVYLMWAGGDHMPVARMLVPVLIPSALLIYALGARIPKAVSISTMGLAAILSIAVAVLRDEQKMDPAAFVGTLVGQHIAANGPQNTTIAVSTAGTTPFYATQNRVFIDMLGLNDPVIAKRTDVPILAKAQNLPGHNKGDGAYVLSRKPDYIIMGPAQGVESEFSQKWFLSDVEIARSPEFGTCYVKRKALLSYSSEVAKRGNTFYKNPIVFTYYQRACD